MFVLDASVAASWCFPDETASLASSVLERMIHEGAVVPALFWFEVRNVLLTGERRQRLTEAQTAQFLSYLDVLGIEIDRGPNSVVVCALARTYQLSVYDAAYLEVAQRKGIPMASLDRALCSAARKAGVPLLGESDPG